MRINKDVEIPIGPVTILVGENGSGKSNIISAYSFLKETMQTFNVQTRMSQITEMLEVM